MASLSSSRGTRPSRGQSRDPQGPPCKRTRRGCGAGSRAGQALGSALSQLCNSRSQLPGSEASAKTGAGGQVGTPTQQVLQGLSREGWQRAAESNGGKAVGGNSWRVAPQQGGGLRSLRLSQCSCVTDATVTQLHGALMHGCASVGCVSARASACMCVDMGV